MEWNEIRSVLRYKTSQVSVCLKDASQVDHQYAYRLLCLYPNRITFCCGAWSPWSRVDAVCAHREPSYSRARESVA